ncbi:hypothetical protein [Streptomyces cinereoruber]|uniref:hypothetical protein n=1 Tax=Streptomyces cinereoruber TaxID=67260 RepID=UPI003626FE87
MRSTNFNAERYARVKEKADAIQARQYREDARFSIVLTRTTLVTGAAAFLCLLLVLNGGPEELLSTVSAVVAAVPGAVTAYLRLKKKE